MTFDIHKAKETLLLRQNARQKELFSLAQEARQDVGRIIGMITDKYHPRRIYQWGSLLEPSRFREWSDIDIAVEGMNDSLDGLHVIDDACKMTRFRVDIVELERIHPRHAQSIREEGKLVYERT